MTEELVTFETAKLAKEKGFDEECMHYWEWYKSDPPMEPLAHARPLIDFREVSKDMWEKAQIRPGLYNSVYHPMKNSNVPPSLYARPTQDLLEKWLREKYGIHCYAKLELGSTESGLPGLYVGGCYTTSYRETAIKWTHDMAFVHQRDALANAIIFGLNLLP